MKRIDIIIKQAYESFLKWALKLAEEDFDLANFLQGGFKNRTRKILENLGCGAWDGW